MFVPQQQSYLKIYDKKGITIISLIVTIVVILILAGITIQAVMSEDGIVEETKASKEEQEKEIYTIRIGILVTNWEVQKSMDETIEISKLWESLQTEEIISNATTDVISLGNGSYQITTTEGYIIKVQVNESGTISELPKGTVRQVDNIVWEGGKATIKLASSISGVTIQYKTDNTGGNWTTYTGSVTNLSNGDIVQVRITDGTITSSGDPNIIVLDEINPLSATITPSSETISEGQTITAEVEHIDNESGIEISECKWVFNTVETPIGTDVSSYTGGDFTESPETITNLTAYTSNNYYLHILSVDKAGNKTESILAITNATE